jgi:hypothetical protein
MDTGMGMDTAMDMGINNGHEREERQEHWHVMGMDTDKNMATGMSTGTDMDTYMDRDMDME